MKDQATARGIALATASGLWLAACGGGDTAAPARPIAPQDDGRILAGSAPIVPADFVGRTFPLVFELTENGAPEARSETGLGSVQVVDNDTLLVTLPGRDVRRFARDPANTNTFVDASGVSAEFTDYGPARYLSVETPFGLSAAYGFETPASARPASATYAARSASVVVLTIPGRETAIGVGGEGSVRLTATFTGSGGTITGTLFDNFSLPVSLAEVDLDTNAVQDELYMRTTLDGTVTETGFTGTVTGTATVRMNGGGDQDFGLSLDATSATGKFFGPSAQAVAGTYSADAEFTIPGQARQSGRLSGFFISE